jgi:hypothetical protein
MIAAIKRELIYLSPARVKTARNLFGLSASLAELMSANKTTTTAATGREESVMVRAMCQPARTHVVKSPLESTLCARLATRIRPN